MMLTEQELTLRAAYREIEAALAEPERADEHWLKATGWFAIAEWQMQFDLEV